MQMNAGAILTAMVLGVLLTGAASWLVAGLYRRRMRVLMRRSPPPDTALAVVARTAPCPCRPAVTLDAASNQRASRRYLFAVSALCLVIGVTQAVLALLFIYGSELLSVGRALTLGVVYAWPMALTWGLVRRWSWLRTLGAIGLYLLAMLALSWWRSASPQPLSTSLGWLGGLVLIPVLVTLVIGASGRIRAVAPYLLPMFMLLATSSVLALQLMVGGVQDPPVWLMELVGAVGAWPAITLLALAPWLLLAWPAWAMARLLAHAYQSKRFSDLWYLLAAYWLVVLGASALPALEGVGWIALTQLIPWLWIPLAAGGLRGWLAPRGQPPTLLVLRVFQQDAGVQAMFDRVVERWRHSGNTVLIAGTDLISRTIDPDDVFTFLNGRLADRFVASEAQVGERLRDFDLAPDPDGRYRVNECYCYDSTWQQALAALVAQADVVLMDLRGFQARNQGCRHELSVLASAVHLQRVVLLFDGGTDRSTALADLAGAPEGRMVWVEAGRLEHRRVAQVVGSLLGAGR